MNKIPIETWTGLRSCILAAVGILVARAAVDDPEATVAGIALAIDTLAMLDHPLVGVELGGAAMSPDDLRLQAEQETADTSKNRRPSWAPALVLGPELLDVCYALELLGADDKPVARLWSVFADPKKLGTWRRNNLSDVPLHGHRVRGFELIAGEKRTGSKRLFRTLKNESGRWDEGPHWVEPGEDRGIRNVQWSINDYKRCLEERIDELKGSVGDDGACHFYRECLARLEVQLAERTDAHERAVERYRQRKRSFELGKHRFAEFLGDPEAQMLAGSRVTGRCSRCGAEVSDPISVERGIGPECVKRVAWHKIVPAEVW